MTSTKSELQSSNEAFSTLKGRVKVVATELKDRRIECRSLNLSVQELTLIKTNLASENKDMSTKLLHFNKLSEERGVEIESLQKSVTELRQKFNSKEKELVEKGSVGDKALNAYKKKAQSLLANANARAATANQARDDAETDANNARAEAEKCLKIAQAAEKEKHEVVNESLKEVRCLETELEEIKNDRERIATELYRTQRECLKAFEEVKENQTYRETLLDELNNKDDELAKEIEKNSGLDQDLAMSRIKVKELEDDVTALQKDLEKATSAAFLARREVEAQSSTSNGGYGQEKEEYDVERNDDTILMLQEELKIANDVIKDLKDSLGTILSNDPSKFEESREIVESINSFGDDNTSKHNHYNQHGNDSTPLFFAFEKQSELNTARDEITRLAALLSESVSEKMEAEDGRDEMRKKMNEAESRLRRFEKLGTSSSGRSSINGSTYTPHHGRLGQSNVNKHQLGVVSSRNDSSVNLEYLKNIMLRYMNARSLNEKKGLIPVIAAVLELTDDEQAQAIGNVEKNAGIQGVGTSLIENVQNKGFVGGLFGDLM